MIRVLQVVGKMHYGGMETLIMNVYRHIDREKVQFDFLVHYEEPGEYDEEIRALGGKIYVMPRTVPQNYFRYKKALRAFFTEHQEYTVIHGHLQSVAFLYHQIAKETGKRFCITHAHLAGIDHDIKGRISYQTSLWAQKYTDAFFGCSMDSCKFFFKNAIKQGKPMTVINNGIETEKYQFSQEQREQVRKELELDNHLVIGHVGRMANQKNHAFLIQIFAEIVKKRPDSILLSIGTGPLESQIKQQVKDLKLEDHVRFLGPRGDVSRLLQGMDLFLFPSLYEGFALTLVESQAAGLKSFTSVGISEVVKITDLLDFINLEQPPEYWADRVLQALPYERENTRKKIIAAGYDIETTAKELEAFYLEHAEKA